MSKYAQVLTYDMGWKRVDSDGGWNSPIIRYYLLALVLYTNSVGFVRTWLDMYIEADNRCLCIQKVPKSWIKSFKGTIVKVENYK